MGNLKFVDTSAIVEMLIAGPQAADTFVRIKTTPMRRATAPTVIHEATVVLANRRNVEVIEAFARYGKGRHPAKLNFGDCFSYAGRKQKTLPCLTSAMILHRQISSSLNVRFANT